MPVRIEICRPSKAQLPLARETADAVMRQVYRHLLGEQSLVPVDLEPWRQSWIALVNEEMMGVGRSLDDRVCDLWLLPQARGMGLGSGLLQRLETEIASRGHARARLRVVAENESARAFYRAHGWQEADGFAHEKLGIPMMNLYKTLPPKQLEL